MTALLKVDRLDWTAFLNIERLDWDGETLSIAGRLNEEAVADAVAVREQILGLNNVLDGTVRPIEYADDPSITGFYTDFRATCDVGPGMLAEGMGRFPVRLTATRLPGRDAPAIEIVSLGGIRTNSHTVVALYAQPWVAVPLAVQDWWDGESSGHTFDHERISEDGTMGVALYTTDLSSTVQRRVAECTLAPSDYWIGAPRFEIASATGTLRPVVGRQLHDTSGANEWRLSNGLVSIDQDPAIPGALRVKNYMVDGSGWSTPRSYQLIFDSPEIEIDTFQATTMKRNRPECVAVRLSLRSGTNRHRHTLDLTLRRGARQVECIWRTPNALLGTVARTTTDAASNLAIAGDNVGIVEASGSSLYHLVTPQAFTADLTDGQLVKAVDATAFFFAIGWTGFFPDSGDGPSDHAAQYMAAMEHSQRVVGR